MSFFYGLLSIFALISTLSGQNLEQVKVEKYLLRVIEAKVSDQDGSGMDGGFLDIDFFGGGEFSLKICTSDLQNCCDTGELNTKDDNWQRGELNFFVGSQLKNCENFPFNVTQAEVEITLKHKGNNGGRLDYLNLLGSRYSAPNLRYHCPIGKELDDDDELTVNCKKMAGPGQHGEVCNGDPRFCQLRFDQFTFPGTHNAGTGQADRTASCFFKNQDLNIAEQLDFGIRFLGFDIIFSEYLPYCNGLETGHGKYPKYGIYQCFGKLAEIFQQIRKWMNEHRNEVIILNFGELENEQQSFPELLKALIESFGDMLNQDYNIKGIWPTLGDAVKENKRIFAFIRSEKLAETETDFFREIAIKSGNETPNMTSNSVTVLSTFKSGHVKAKCDFVLKSAQEKCQYEADLVKISLIGSPGKGTRAGTECLWDIARKCNSRVLEVYDLCLSTRKNSNFKSNINFIQVDYPNYPGNGKFDLVQFCHQVNLEKIK